MGTSNDSVKREFEALVREYFPRDAELLLMEYYARYPAVGVGGQA